MPSTHIRQATSADLERVTELFIAYRAFYRRCDDKEQARSFMTERFERGDSLILVAEDDTTVCGFAQVFYHFSSLQLRTILTLNDLFVDPQYRNNESGRKLVDRVIHVATAQGAYSVRIETGTNNIIARGLYTSLGFVEVDHDDEFMVLELVLEK
ncbi:GNAT family N-acetyltransferase [Corynebacterium sp. ES2794-CONJ1]|uniref:GNAT family N-acetyltransferase n=1 Tax=unclassified Corynebacterium TaxID=2624378 RepID=UPI002167AD62|nr:MULTISPECIES: GNAT family N-acetyltransferase [unclassified Corynebacterium]MCS4489861.1 GNAT family N-acetyltransferase [Corynebacterium sp. ES2775-CONJ]MCS4491775.1 GNAT family N-acetyltransferase [Corynebacterium sp. ES2715-CONJ3]MCS4531880.1 GNAT family N-acetyltransferase [Corynebacterium sp. ES2730-CONJ]MCU9519277.1 GNAT family N-acetyltransferase [Corynebacterium sp. ES2794-CONJ1]